MSLRLALILTGVWTLLVFAGCAGIITYIANGPVRQQQERASKAGGGFGIVAAAGYGGIWVPWAAAYGRKRRERLREQSRRPDVDEEELPRNRRGRPPR